jgi:hypothetical protein
MSHPIDMNKKKKKLKSKQAQISSKSDPSLSPLTNHHTNSGETVYVNFDVSEEQSYLFPILKIFLLNSGKNLHSYIKSQPKTP